MNIDRPPDPVFVPEAPGIRENAYAQSVDQTYRTMEAASIERARAAADILEVTESEMSHLKITNMRDPSEMREGDIAAINPPPPPGLLSGGSKPGFQQLGGVIPDYAPGVGAPNAGEAARQTVTANHASRAAQLVGAGQMGSYRE